LDSAQRTQPLCPGTAVAERVTHPLENAMNLARSIAIAALLAASPN
jgi:hypothetical protein